MPSPLGLLLCPVTVGGLNNVDIDLYLAACTVSGDKKREGSSRQTRGENGGSSAINPFYASIIVQVITKSPQPADSRPNWKHKPQLRTSIGMRCCCHPSSSSSSREDHAVPLVIFLSSTVLPLPALIRSRRVYSSAKTIANTIESPSNLNLDTTSTEEYTAYAYCHANITKDHSRNVSTQH